MEIFIETGSIIESTASTVFVAIKQTKAAASFHYIGAQHGWNGNEHDDE